MIKMDIELSPKQKEIFADRIIELANLSLVVLVLNQFIAKAGFDLLVVVGGGVSFVVLYLVAYLISRPRRRSRKRGGKK